MREGELGDGFYIIVSGQAKVTVQTRENSTFLLSTLTDGDHFGETALLTHGPRVATVSASSNMLLLFLSALRFKRFERLAPEVFSEAFEKIAAQRTTQLLKTIPLFDVLCLEKAARDASEDADGKQVVASANDVTRQKYDEGKLSLLASLFSYESFNLPKTVIFHEGDRADKLYILVRGSVEVSAKVESGVVVLNKLSQGDFFGQNSATRGTSVSLAAGSPFSVCVCPLSR
jgi:CRP-like cAMP-binding protein